MKSMTMLSLALMAAASVSARATESGAPGKTLGFAIIDLPFSLAKNADDCPNGFAMSAKDIFLASVAKAEQERLQKPENLKEFEQKAYNTSDGKDLCSVPTYPRAPQRTPQGKMSFGMNLDGTTDGHATPNSCGHPKFQGPDGQPVDNQLYRVIGCSSNLRGFPGERGYLESLRLSGFYDGGTTLLIEVKNVHDMRNDDNVELGIYNGADPLVTDPNGKQILPYASLSVTDDPKYRTTVHARIVDGVLTTDAFDFHLHYDFGAAISEYNVRGGRIRLEFQPNGEAKGMMAGYIELYDADPVAGKGALNEKQKFMQKVNKQYLAEMIGRDCPSYAQAVWRYADGYPDPKTGECTSISTAWDIKAIPAFVMHPETQKSAAVEKTVVAPDGKAKD